jgi:hypothetical protein
MYDNTGLYAIEAKASRLTLESAKAPIEMPAIDHMEKSSAN